MKIDSIRIKNWKSLDDVSLSFENLTTLIGENGVGKSSVIEALDWAFDGSSKHPSKTEVSVVITELGEKSELLHINGDPIKVDSIEFTRKAESREEKPTYEFSLGELKWRKNQKHLTLWKPNDWFEVITIKADEKPDKEKILNQLLNDAFSPSLSSQKIALDSARERLKNSDPAKALNESLKSVLDISIDFKISEESFSKPVIEKTFSKNKDTFDVSSLNDGDFRMLAVALKKLQLSSEKHNLLIIDEVELSQHGIRIFRMMQDLKELANFDPKKDVSRTQVLISTHNYHAIDFENTIYVLKLASHSVKTVVRKIDLDKKITKQFSIHPHLNEIFFQRRVVLFEGEGDLVTFSTLMKKFDLEAPEGVWGFSCASRESIFPLTKALKAADIDFYIICDGDVGRLPKKEDGTPPEKGTIDLVTNLGYTYQQLQLHYGNNISVFPCRIEEEISELIDRSKDIKIKGQKNISELEKIESIENSKIRNFIKRAYGV